MKGKTTRRQSDGGTAGEWGVRYQNGSKISADKIVFRPCLFTYILFSCPFLLIAGLFLIDGWTRGRFDLQGLAEQLLIPAFFIFWIGSHRIELDLEVITYRAFLAKTRRLFWTEIYSVSSGIRRRANRGPYFMELARSDSSPGITINIKLFGANDLTRLSRIIAERAPQAKLDASTRAMMDGKMPSIYGK